FAFSAYLGGISNVPPSGVAGAVMCLLAIFLPSFLLIFGALPFWEKIRHLNGMKAAMQGVNAAVVGLLIAAFYNPVWTDSISSKKDFSLAVFAFLLLVLWRRPSWQVVLLGAVIGNFVL
ncbi:MAG: chromate transporter, partial [Pseudobdellovibrionaceae bacterium]